MADDDPDPLLNAREAGAACDPPMPANDWRSRVARGSERGSAPKADDPGDLNVPVNRRTPRWRLSTVRRWNATRRGPGRPRMQFANDPDSPFEIVRRDGGSPRCKFMLREKDSGRIVRRFATASAAQKFLAELDRESATE